MIHTLESWDTHWTHTSKAWDTVGYNNYKFWDTLYLQDCCGSIWRRSRERALWYTMGRGEVRLW